MQQQEYAQISEFGLGSLIGDFFQNVKDTVSGVAKAVAPIAPYVIPFVAPHLGITSALGQQLLGAGIGLAAGQKPVDVAKNMALQAATSGIASSLTGGKFGQSFKQQLGISDTTGQEPGFMKKYITGEDSLLRQTFDPTQRGERLTSAATKFDQAMGQAGAYQDYYKSALDKAVASNNPEVLSTFLNKFPSPTEKTGFGYQYGPLFAASSALLPLVLPQDKPEEGAGYDEAERERFTFSYARPRNTGDGLTAIPGAPVDNTSFIRLPFEPSDPRRRAQEIADQFRIPMLVAADGGEVTGGIANTGQKIEHPDGKVREHPKRIGEIAGAGTGTSDDIPAMLSDGEFVMTAQAVRNAGGGSRKAGAKNMYKLMKSLEKGGSLSQQSMGMVGRA